MRPDNSENQLKDARRFGLIIATSSAYLVECLCERIGRWSLVDGTYINQGGNKVENSEGLVKLNNEITALYKIGIQVAWCHVLFEDNEAACRLAHMAL